MNRLFRTLCAIGLTGTLFVACGQEPIKTSEELSSESIEESEVVEDSRFLTIDNDGNVASDSIFSDYDVTIVNYWAVYCPYCIEEMPGLEEYASQLDDNIQLIGAVSIQDKDEGIRVILTEEEAATKAKFIMDENGATYKNIISNESFKDFIDVDIRQFPSFILVDTDGNVIKNSVTSFFDAETFDTMINDYLEDGVIETSYDPEYEELLAEPYYEDGEKFVLENGETIIAVTYNDEMIGILEDELAWYYANTAKVKTDEEEKEFVEHLSEVTRELPRR